MRIYSKIRISSKRCMNTSNGSSKKRPSIVTKASPNFLSSFNAISKVDDNAEEETDCEER